MSASVSDFLAWCTKAAVRLNVYSSSQSRNDVVDRCQLLSKVFWSVVFVISARATARTALTFISGYANSQTKSQPKIMIDATFSLLSTAICMPLSPSELEQLEVQQNNFRSSCY
jgi:hypothetical protein